MLVFFDTVFVYKFVSIQYYMYIMCICTNLNWNVALSESRALQTKKSRAVRKMYSCNNI